MNNSSAINSFDLYEISNVIETITKSPKRSNIKVDAIYDWKEKRKNTGHGETAFQTNLECKDNVPPNLRLNKNEWVVPIKLLLESITKSMSITMLVYAASRGISIAESRIKATVEVDIRGFLGLDKTVGSRFREINIKMILMGNLSEPQKNELLKSAMKAPVYDVLKNKVDVKTSIQLVFNE